VDFKSFARVRRGRYVDESMMMVADELRKENEEGGEGSKLRALNTRRQSG
jgi:hypothetical protein